MADAPPVKPWGQNDKDLLQKLINRGKIDITRTGDTDYIDRIRHKYFRPRDTLNFRRNFRSYTRSRDLEDHLSGNRRERRGTKNVNFTAFITLHLTSPSSFHLLISENDGDSSDEDSNDTDSSDEDTDDADASDDLFPMAKTAPKKRGAAAGGRNAAPKKSAGRKTTGEETIDLDTPPRKKPRAPAARYSIEERGCYTVNPYAHRSKNKIDVVLHEGGVPTKDAQPQVSLLLGGKTLSVQWKTSEKLFSELQASAQGIARDSSRFMGYSDTMQELKKAGVVPIEGYYRGPPQIIKLDVECTGEPKVKISPVLSKETVFYKGKQHVQFNSMYVCTLKVAGERHGITAQAQRGEIVDFGFLGSQNSASIDRGGGGGDGGNAAPEQQGGRVEESENSSSSEEDD